MKIGVDARPLQTGHRYRGIGRYAHQMLKALKKIDTSNKYFLFIDKKLSGGDQIKEEFSSENFIIEELFFPFSSFIDDLFLNIPNSQFVFPNMIRKKQIDIFYSFSDFISVFLKKKFIITIYGLNPFFYNIDKRIEMEKKIKPVSNVLDWIKLASKKFQNYLFKKIIYKQIKTASAIITSSNNSKDNIAIHLKIPESKVIVVPEAVDLSLFGPENTEKISIIKEKYGIKYPYFLFVSAVEWLKNVHNMIEGYILSREKFLYPHQLIIAGIAGRGINIFRKMVEEKKLEEEIIFTGYIPDHDVKCLYNSAEGYILPSYYEGFPMTALEAMACGCPVLASNTSSMPEVIGNAGLYFNPENPVEISQSLIKIEDKILREKLTDEGFGCIKKFTWENSAQKIVKVFEETFNKKNNQHL